MRGPTAIWQALEAARGEVLSDRGLPPAVAGAEGLTRRRLLASLAVAGVAGVVGAFPRPARAALSGPVAIIGGGIAGLSALWHLTEAGIDARLFESRRRLGGRMLTVREGGLPPLEMGGQFVNTGHDDIRTLAATHGVSLVDRKAGPHRTVILEGGVDIPRDRLIAALKPIAAQIDRDARALDADYARAAPPLDRLSFTGYLDAHAALIREPWVRRLLEATARTEYGVEPGEASALELVFNLPAVDGRSVDVLSRSDERYLIAGGSSALSDAIARRLEPRIVPYRRATRVAARGDGVRITFSNGDSFDATAVICTVPASIMSRIDWRVPLPPLWRRFIAEVGLGQNAKTQAAYAGRPWEGVLGRGGELWQTDGRVGVSLGWDGSVRPGSGAGGVWTWFGGGAEARTPGDAAAFAKPTPFLAGTAPTAVRRSSWGEEPFSRGAYVNFRPGQLTRFAELIWTESAGLAAPPLSAGRVLFAGEHLSDAYPGYMNGAAQTGRLAAQTIIAARAPARRLG